VLAQQFIGLALGDSFPDQGNLPFLFQSVNPPHVHYEVLLPDYWYFEVQ
jgi:hypothetical protein